MRKPYGLEKLAGEEKLRLAILGKLTNSTTADEKEQISRDEKLSERNLIKLKEKLRDILETLTERERKVLELRFGLGGGYKKTLEELGQQFKVTRERIRQIEAKAVRKMRHPSRLKQLEGYENQT